MFGSPRIVNWYGERWWLEDQYRGFLPNVTPEGIETAIARVAKVFGPTWTIGAEPHPASMLFLSRGTLPLEGLVALGSDLLDLEDCLRPSILHDLRTPSHYGSTRLELGLAAIFRRKSFAVELRPELPSGKRADIRVRAGMESVFFEVKRLAASEAQESISRLSFALIAKVGEILRTDPSPDVPTLGYEIELSDAINELMGAGADSDDAFIQGITSQVVTAVTAQLERQSPPFTLGVAGLVRVQIGPNIRGSLSGPTISPVADLKRALGKFLRNVGEQLHPDHPGILVCQASSVLDGSIARVLLEPLLASQEQARHVSAVVFLPVYSSLPQRQPFFPPFAVLNPAATASARELSAYRVLAEHFGIED